MANTVVVMDGFENFVASTKLTSYLDPAYTNYLASGAGVGGGLALRLGNSNSYWYYSRQLPIPTLNTTWLIASFVYKRLAATSVPTFHIGFGNATTSYSTTNCRMGLQIAADGSLVVRHSTASVASAPGIIFPDLWYHIEYRHRYGNATFGNFEIRVNGTLVHSGLGDNSGVSLATTPFVGLSGYGTLSATVSTFFDDLIVATSTDASPAWLGISKVRHLIPTSTVTGEWAGSDGNSVDNHLLVDDGDAASTDWVTSTAGTAQRDLYGHAASSTGATIHAAAVRAAAATDDVGIDDFSLVLKSGATESLTKKTLGAGAPIWVESAVVSNDPATGTAWTKAGFDASVFGVKS